MHGYDRDKPHHLNTVIRQLLTNETRFFDAWFKKSTLSSLKAHLSGSPILIRPTRAPENSDFGRNTVSRLEFRRQEYLFGIIHDAAALALQTIDPILSCCAVARD